MKPITDSVMDGFVKKYEGYMKERERGRQQGNNKWSKEGVVAKGVMLLFTQSLRNSCMCKLIG
jgi:hypothetical protein